MHYLHSLLGGGYDNDYHINNVAAEIAEDGRASPSVISPQSQVTKRVAKMVMTNPMLLQPDVCANLVPTVQFLVNLCDFTNDELAHVISAAPGILGLSVKRNLRPTIDTLGDILREDCGNVGTSSSRSIRSVGNPGKDINEVFSKTLLGKCILKHPQILALLLDNLLAKRDYFNGIDNYREIRADANPERLEKGKSSLAARILISAPSTYSLSLTNNIIPKVDFLAKLWNENNASAACNNEVDINGRRRNCGRCNNISDNLREYPQILTLSKEGNIIPTLVFYNMTGYVRLDSNALPVEMRQPKFNIRSRYIATSLYNRLLPRWHFLLREEENRQLLGLDWYEKSNTTLIERRIPKYILPSDTSPLSSSSRSIANKDAALPPLHLLAGASDEVFCRQMKLSLEEYLDFKAEAASRLKFSSQFDRWLKTGRPID